MFWIPISVIAIIIWYVVYLSNDLKSAQYDREYQQKRNAVAAFRSLATDEDMERELRWQFDDNKIDCNAVVRAFMGGDSKWDDYTGGNAYGRRKAEMVLMAQKGKFPGPTFSFSLGSTNPKSRFSQEQWTSMNVEYLFRLENELRQRLHQNVVLYAAYDTHENGESNRYRRRLSECVRLGERKYITWAATLEFAIE